MILFLVPVGVAVLSEEPCCCQWHFSMTLILKTVLCQGGDWSDEQKCDFKKRKKHDLCGVGEGVGGSGGRNPGTLLDLGNVRPR